MLPLPPHTLSAPLPRQWLPQEGALLGLSWWTQQRFPDLAAMLGRWRVVSAETHALAADGFAGWGRKLPARMVQRLAQARQRPFWTLEDGFLRSVGLGKHGWPGVSFVMDDLGVHFDASTPSRLESILSHEDLGPLHADAGAACALIVRHRLTKYNHLPDRPVRLPGGRGRRILLVDQVAGDHSIAGALASPQTFASMLQAALVEPDARIILRPHPDVAAGKAQGLLAGLALPARLIRCEEQVSPHAMLDVVDEVWTVSSQLGFDALLRGIPVRCFGAAFYAGWGLTQDVLAPAPAVREWQQRRASAPRRTLADLVAATLLRYCLYFDPVRRCGTDFEGAVARLLAWRDHARLWQGTTRAHGISRHKRPVLRAWCSPAGGSVSFDKSGRLPDRHLVWGTRGEARLEPAIRHGPLIRIEDGFVRSVGLGSAKHFPLSLCFDASGLHYDATRPSDLETMLQSRHFSGVELRRAASLRLAIVAAAISKYNLPAGGLALARTPAAGQTRIVVFGQVPDDESIRLGLCLHATNLAFLAEVRRSCPRAFIVYREHPDLAAGHRTGPTPAAAAAEFADAFVARGEPLEWIGFADEVHVRTSLAGFEALLRGKRVVCHGVPFYSGWGLTQDRVACPRRTRQRTLDELVAAALIHYPSYLDPVSRLPMQAEDAIDRIVRQRAELKGSRM